MKTGIYTDTADIYHAEPHLGSTSIKAMRVTAAHFNHVRTNGLVKTPAMFAGTVAHSGVIDNDLSGYVVKPADFDGRTKAGKEFMEANAGKPMITTEMYVDTKAMRAVLETYGEAMRLIEGAKIETSVYVIDPVSGQPVKARPDIWKPGIIADYKTTKSIAGFERDIFNLGYEIQAGVYSIVTELVTGIPITEFRWIAQERTGPYAVQVFRLSRQDLESAKVDARILINQCAVAIETNHFPGYEDRVKEVTRPAYRTSEILSFEEAV